MSRFTRPLRVSPVPPKGAEWCLIEPFGYDIDFEGSGETVEVPRGFVTDFASVPPGGRWLLPKWGPYGNAAVVHDFLYWEQDRLQGLNEIVTRKRADEIMLEAMKNLPVPAWKKWLIYGALRAGGWMAWRQNKLNWRSGFSRVIEPEKLDADYRHERPGLLEEEAARVGLGKQEPRPQPSGLARFSEKLAKVVAPAVLERALGRRPRHDQDDRVRAGELSADELLAAELRAEGLRDALTELDNVKKKRDRRLADLEHQRRELANRIDKLEKAEPPGEAPERSADEVAADFQRRLEKHERESLDYQQRDKLPEMRKELEERLEEIAEKTDAFAGEIENCERKIEQERSAAIIAALVGLADATGEALDEDFSMGFTLALATDRVHALLEHTFLAPIRDEKQRAEVTAAARGVIEKLGALVDKRLEEPGRQGKVESDFLSTAGTVLPHYEKNLDSLNWIKNRLSTFPGRGKATESLKQIEELLANTEELRGREEWDLLKETGELTGRVEKLRGDIRSAGVVVMEKELEIAGLSQVLQAWVLLSQRAAQRETTDRNALAGKTAELCFRIADQIAAKLGFDPESKGEDESIERAESIARAAFVQRIAASRLLVDEAEQLLDGDDTMQFLLRRRELELKAAKRVSRDRRALWWVLLPLAPALWLLLRGSMKSLRQFFGVGAKPEEAPQVYLELGTLARTVLAWAGYGYGLLALLSVARLFWQCQPVAAAGTNLWLLGFVGVNFLGCCLYLIWQTRSIHLPGRKSS